MPRTTLIHPDRQASIQPTGSVPGPIHDDDLAHGRFSVWVAGWRVVRAKALTPDWLRVPEAGKVEDTLVPKPQRPTIHRRARRSRNPLARGRFWVGQLRLREVSTREVYSAPAVGLGGPGFRPWRTESRSWSGGLAGAPFHEQTVADATEQSPNEPSRGSADAAAIVIVRNVQALVQTIFNAAKTGAVQGEPSGRVEFVGLWPGPSCSLWQISQSVTRFESAWLPPRECRSTW